MKVLKFGGTSVGSAVNIKKVHEIVSGRQEDVIVVVSALGGITDKILNAAKMAALGSEFYHDEMTVIRQRHLEVVNELFDGPEEIIAEINPLLQELEQVMMGVTLVSELTPKTLDRLLGMGERLSSLIVSRYFGCELKDASRFIVTDNHFGKAAVDFNETNKRIVESFARFQGVAIVAGF
ncbi:MAG TPA: bifunctional aspartate kinase/homoserine dehydrogenase I, partial [Prolixibacteraceae bacterium]|nr:bifunctional aspartate kinase/homoserine dehydrogenase I [Prolixibacteraceae bacterium]